MPSVPTNLTTEALSLTTGFISWENPDPVMIIVGTNGQEFHLFQARCQVKEYNESKEFAIFRNDLGDGHRAKTLFGSNTGLRRFNLSLPTLQGGSAATLIGYGGETVTQEQYIWDLYSETQINGPFVIRSARNGQNYLVEFVDAKLTYQRMLSKLYSTGLELVQVRLPGVSVFDVSLMGPYAHFDETTHDTGWLDKMDLTRSLAVTGDVTFGAVQQSGKDVVRFNSTTNNGRLDASEDLPAAEVVLVMKMREGTFSNNAGILSGATSLLKGDDTTTKFQNLSLPDYRYFLNGQELETTNQQAPMSEWGVVHVRLPLGSEVSRIGQDLSVAGTFAELDLAEKVVFDTHRPISDMRELAEHLVIKWL